MRVRKRSGELATTTTLCETPGAMNSAIRSSLSVVALASACLIAGCDGGSDEMTHGFVKLELRRSDAEESDPYVGTARIVASLEYGTCLTNFYQREVDWHADGTLGEEVFGAGDGSGENWKDLLCAEGAPYVECEILELDQQLDAMPPRLTVAYDVAGADIEGRLLKFGPLPTPELAACEAGLLPSVNIGPSSLQGFDGSGNLLWEISSFNPSAAATNDGGAIRISASRT